LLGRAARAGEAARPTERRAHPPRRKRDGRDARSDDASPRRQRPGASRTRPAPERGSALSVRRSSRELPLAGPPRRDPLADLEPVAGAEGLRDGLVRVAGVEDVAVEVAADGDV